MRQYIFLKKSFKKFPPWKSPLGFLRRDSEYIDTYYVAHKRNTALTALEKFCCTLESKLGKRHPDLYLTKLILVECLRTDTQCDEAVEILEGILALAEETHSEASVRLTAESQLGEIKFLISGDRDSLLQFFKAQIKGFKRMGLKANHPMFLVFKNSLNELLDIEGVPVYDYLLSQAIAKPV